jgi:hypothetical protein
MKSNSLVRIVCVIIHMGTSATVSPVISMDENCDHEPELLVMRYFYRHESISGFVTEDAESAGTTLACSIPAPSSGSHSPMRSLSRSSSGSDLIIDLVRVYADCARTLAIAIMLPRRSRTSTFIYVLDTTASTDKMKWGEYQMTHTNSLPTGPERIQLQGKGLSPYFVYRSWVLLSHRNESHSTMGLARNSDFVRAAGVFALVPGTLTASPKMILNPRNVEKYCAEGFKMQYIRLVTHDEGNWAVDGIISLGVTGSVGVIMTLDSLFGGIMVPHGIFRSYAEYFSSIPDRQVTMTHEGLVVSGCIPESDLLSLPPIWVRVGYLSLSLAGRDLTHVDEVGRTCTVSLTIGPDDRITLGHWFFDRLVILFDEMGKRLGMCPARRDVEVFV